VLFNIILLVTRWLLTRRNVEKKTESQQTMSTTEADGAEKITHSRAFDDLTDRENPDFRYVY